MPAPTAAAHGCETERPRLAQLSSQPLRLEGGGDQRDQLRRLYQGADAHPCAATPSAAHEADYDGHDDLR